MNAKTRRLRFRVCKYTKTPRAHTGDTFFRFEVQTNMRETRMPRVYVTTATLVSASLSKLSCSRAQTPMAPLKLFDLQRSGRTCMNSDEPARGANRSHLLLLLHICQATPPPPLLPPSSRQRATGVGAQSCVCAARGQAEPNPVLTEDVCC